MPRLTRTQKYADLREQLANDSERSIQNEQLAQFENKVNNIQQQVENFQQPVEQKTTPLFEDLKKIEIPSFEPVQPVKQEVPVVETDSFESIIASIKEETAKLEETTSHTFKFDEQDFAQFVEQPLEDKYEETPVIEEPVYEEPVVTEPVYEEPIVAEPIIEEPIVAEPIEDEEPLNFESLFDDQAKSVLKETIEEVKEYNQNDGVKNIEEITKQMVDDIRHPEAREEIVDQEEEVIAPIDTLAQDEEFSNTVSMEITKIMDQLDSTKPNPVIDEKVEEEKEESDFLKSYFNVDDSLVNNNNNNDGIEIKNLNELEPSDEISDTIPFMISNGEVEDEDEEDYDEDEGSNIVLNVILIVLIVILLAVLGLIVFYILKTKGIIG